ncbi:HNH endonuclease [Acinetobacter junii]|uniref:HNH endonuclease n=1 Tax=Acinetobacter junii TaxID=40215 RepID=UPI00244CB148|nr:HNH endonuclease [Acinetobacter junii]MDH1690796.1 HNH endonuclease [Acinetobacter junii]
MNLNYRSLFGKQKPHTEFTKCIICLDPHDESNPNKRLTGEHIVPEFIGGKIEVKNVCKDCNSKLGHELEGPLSNNIFFKLYTYSNNIKGKKGKLINPLSGEYTYNGVRFRYENDFSLYQLPVINPQPTPEGGFKLGVSIDKRDLRTIENDVFKTISRKIKKSGRALKEDKLKKDIKRVIEDSKNNIKVISQPEIKVSFSLDFDQIGILAIKMIYELVAWLSGEDFISCNEFNFMRISLRKIKLHSKLKYNNDDFYKIFRSLLEENPYYDTKNISKIDEIFSKNKTIIIFINGGCYVRVLSLWYNFIMPKALKDAFLIFTSDSKTGDFKFYREDIFLLS